MHLTNQSILKETIQHILSKGKGILAADESPTNIGPKFAAINLDSTPETRRLYREHLFTTNGCEQYISGVILHEETFDQHIDGQLCPQYLASKGIIAGIKVDRGTVPAAFSPTEKITEGLDGLNARLKTYFDRGARFAKWRAVIQISDHLPSHAAIHGNVTRLTEYAALCLQNGIIPIVEPEVLAEGNHDASKTQQVTQKVLTSLFDMMKLYELPLDLILLKPNMIVPGLQGTLTDPASVAALTLECFKATVPVQVPGIVFLSGGQSDIDATVHLNEMVKSDASLPWTLTFSYGRALQTGFLKIWLGKPENVDGAQSVFLHRCKMNSLATQGLYSKE